MDEKRTELAPLTGLRGIAAYSVMFAHALDTHFLYPTGASVFHALAYRIAYFGMSLFFVLSGFVLFYTYGDRIAQAGRSFGRVAFDFFVARFARLYPLYIFALIVYSPHGLPDVFKSRPVTLILYATLTQSWFNQEIAFFPPDWSISTEWFFYFFFIPLALLVARFRRPLATLIVYSLGASIGIFLLFQAAGPHLETVVQRYLFWEEAISYPAGWWLHYTNPPLRLLEFVAGMISARVYLKYRSRMEIRFLPGVAYFASFVCILIIAVVDINGVFKQILPNIIFTTSLVALMTAVCLSQGSIAKILSSRTLVFAGGISYSVYMWSFLVLRLFPPTQVNPGFSVFEALPSVSDTVLIMIMTTFVATGSYQLLESPARRWIRAALTLPRRLSPPAPATSWGARATQGRGSEFPS